MMNDEQEGRSEPFRVHCFAFIVHNLRPGKTVVQKLPVLVRERLDEAVHAAIAYLASESFTISRD
jgi:hypothetical protein